MSILLLASAPVAVILAAATGYRWIMLLACAYATVVLACYFVAVAP